MRNPLDVIADHSQYFNMKNHGLKYAESLHIDFLEWWTEFVEQTAMRLHFNHQNVIKSLTNQIPTFFIRYEDLVTNPETVLTNCASFFLGVPKTKLTGTILEKRINIVSQECLGLKS